MVFSDGSARFVPATTNGIRMKPPWLMLEYASMRTMLVCRRASTLPTVIVSAASTKMNGCQTSLAGGKREVDHAHQGDEAAGLGGDADRNAVTGVGAPW